MTLSDRITITKIGDVRVATLKTNTPGVVSLTGAFMGGKYLVPENPLITGVLLEYLKEGTESYSRADIRDSLERWGASIGFYGGWGTVSFSGSVLTEHVGRYMDVVGELLLKPTFPSKAFGVIVDREIAELDEILDDTDAMSTLTIRKTLYPQHHPNTALTVPERKECLTSMTRKMVRNHHEAWRGLHDLTVVMVGDIDHKKAVKAVRLWLKERSMSKKFIERPLPGSIETVKVRKTPITIPVAGKINTTIDLAKAVPVRLLSNEYIPFRIATDMLGGGMTAHLMQTIRERDGLTYGIYSYRSGFTDNATGFWGVSGNFAPSNAERAQKAIIKEMKRFLAVGLTDEAIEKRKEEIANSYTVSLSTNRGIATDLLEDLMLGRDVAYIDRYPEMVLATPNDEIRRVAKKYLNPENMLLVIAGSV